MFEKKKKATKNEEMLEKAPAAGAVELSDDVLEAAAGGYAVWRDLPPGFKRRAARAWGLAGSRDGGGFVSVK